MDKIKPIPHEPPPASDGALVARRLLVTGVVQGVGFRPFVYRLATRCGVAGTTANTAAGVEIVIEGEPAQVEAFLAAFPVELPPLAVLTSLAVSPTAAQRRTGFKILPSTDESAHRVLVPPDVSVCPACVAELLNPADRRFRYPFINCTDCGPRYTMVADVPFDRPQTTMNEFPLCAACRHEYENPDDRRFHAQAICCPTCGPRLALFDPQGNAVTTPDPLATARDALAAGQIVAVKGLGGFHLACDASSATAVEELRRRKGRGRKPFALMVRTRAAVRVLAQLAPAEAELLESPVRPILLLRRCDTGQIAPGVAPGTLDLGIMLPYTPLHRLLLEDPRFGALVMTSGNLADEPIITEDDEAFRRLGHVADLFLTHNRRILHRADDSIVKITDGRQQMWRRSRGYVPRPLHTQIAAPPILAVGGMMKNCIALTRGQDIFISQHLGDTDTREGIAFFEDTVAHFQQLLGVTPECVVHDLHPDYLTTRYALASAIPRKIGVQHHHAHIASCQCEHEICDRDVIGLALDGTGYGLDGTIWGGEFLVGRPPHYRRAAHFEAVPMPGGERAIREPWRMAISFLRATVPAFRALPLPLLTTHAARLDDLETMMERHVQAPLTSSCGRLFDAVAAILGLADLATFEGEPAVRLEMAATPNDLRPYPCEITPPLDGNGPRVLRTTRLIQGVLHDLAAGISVGDIAYRFHRSLVELLAITVRELAVVEKLNTVVLGGGCFLNSILRVQLTQHLEKEGFTVFQPEQVPPGDGGVSLGQIACARAILLSSPEHSAASH